MKDEKDIEDKIFIQFNDFKKTIQRIFEIFNEKQFVERII